MTLVPFFCQAEGKSCLLQLFIFYTPSFLLKFLCSSWQKKNKVYQIHCTSSHPTEKLDSRLNFLHTNLISTSLCLSSSWNLSLACCLKEQKKRHTTPQLSLEDQCPESETWKGRRNQPLSEALLLSWEMWRRRSDCPHSEAFLSCALHCWSLILELSCQILSNRKDHTQ